MYLEIAAEMDDAIDLGYLLHKHPDRPQSFELAYGKAHVFYPEVLPRRCAAGLLLELDPVGLVRNRRGPVGEGFALAQYVNDRPYAVGSFLSVAIAQVYGSALSGRSRERPALAETPLALTAELAAVPSRGGELLLRKLFEPLGYTVAASRAMLDPEFPEWGESRFHTLTLTQVVRLRELLAHLYVLLPVLDDDKHYWIGDDEVEKLLRHGDAWLPAHPERDLIVERYLRRQRKLIDVARARLVVDVPTDDDEADPESVAAAGEAALEALVSPVAAETVTAVAAASEVVPGETLTPADSARETPAERASLHELRLREVAERLASSGAERVVDLGCGEGKLLRKLLACKRFTEIVGMDVCFPILERAAERLRLTYAGGGEFTSAGSDGPHRAAKLRLLNGSLMYRDRRLEGFDAAALVEVVEHLDPPRLAAAERTVFECARPGIVAVTTPNREYNVLFPTLPAGQFRHGDHRFEWTRPEFRAWAEAVAGRFGYAVEILPLGPVDPLHGAPTQLAWFTRLDAPPATAATTA